MGIIIGAVPQERREEPVVLPESEIKSDAAPVESREENAAQAVEAEAEAVSAPVKRPAKKAKRNGKK